MDNDKILDIKRALADMGGDREIYKEVLAVFLLDTPQLLDDLTLAYKDKNLALLKRLSHSVKSSSRTIGGLSMGDAASRLEKELQKNTPENIQAHIQQLKTEFMLLTETLKRENL